MSARARRPARRRLEAWLWTGPVGHLLGGALDFASVLTRELLRRHPPPWRGRGN